MLLILTDKQLEISKYRNTIEELSKTNYQLEDMVSKYKTLLKDLDEIKNKTKV